MKRLIAAFAAGLLFGAGLIVSGMTMPSKVLGFLDVAGAWDASLAFVMVGGIGLNLLQVTKIRLANLLPGLVLTPILVAIFAV